MNAWTETAEEIEAEREDLPQLPKEKVPEKADSDRESKRVEAPLRRRGIRAANAVLFTLCCFLLAEIANKISAELLLPESRDAPPPPTASEIPTHTWNERKPILQRNLFGAQIGGEPSAEVEPELEDIEETELPLELLGTIAADSRATSRATIWNEEEREYQVLREGDALRYHPDVTVDHVERRRVILLNGEQREELTLEDREKRLNTPAARKARASEARARKAKARRAPARQRRRRRR